MEFKKTLSSLMVLGAVTTAQADVCKSAPGNIICGKGTISQLSENGMVTMNGTIVESDTHINGMLNADEAHFSSLNVNGSVNLTQCTVHQDAEIKGALKASSSIFEKSLGIFSNTIRLMGTKINENLQIHHTESLIQEVYLDNRSEIGGNIVFDDGRGKVYLSKRSKIHGAVIGGEVINK